jgi:hypothetical protein
MFKKITIVTVTVAAAAGLALAASTPALAGTGAMPIADVVPALKVAQTQADVPPSIVDLEALGNIDPASLRAVGSDDVASYWVGQSSTTDICLITYIRGGNEVSGSSCRSIPDFQQFGLAMITGEDTSDPTRSAEAYYLPADISVDSVGATEHTATNARSTTSNFTAGRPGALDLSVADVPRGDGSTFHFQPLTLPSK